MNVFYMGLTNPITVAASGIAAEDLKVTCEGAELRPLKGGKIGQYEVISQRPGKATISVSGTGLAPQEFVFRVKRLPDPEVLLGNTQLGRIDAGAMRAQRGLIAYLGNSNYDVRCKVSSFTIIYTEKSKESVPIPQQGNLFTGAGAQVIKLAKPGDTYHFTNIKVRCPGDQLFSF